MERNKVNNSVTKFNYNDQYKTLTHAFQCTLYGVRTDQRDR